MNTGENLVSNQHWRTETDTDNILWLSLDRYDKPVNSLNAEVFDQLDSILTEISKQNPRAVVLRSGKEKGFIAGADISEFSTLNNSEEAFALVRKAQQILDKLEALPMPTIALISGFCVGGGCELALACDYRIAEDISDTRIGLPEVKLGIHPGWGGTVRLPALIGVLAAMPLILSGKILTATQAAKIGMVDVALQNREIQRAVRQFALQPLKRKRPSKLLELCNQFWVRPLLGKIFLNQLAKRASESHYPAPFAVIRNWIKEGIGKHAYLTEAKSIANLLTSDSSRQLVRVFFLQEKLKALTKRKGDKIDHVHVIGAGTMGGDIAAWCAYKGFYVTLQDTSTQNIAASLKRAHALYTKKLKKPRLVQAVMDRLQPDIKGIGVKKADLVIEAIFEDLEAKRTLYEAIEPQLKPETILATNTSSIPLKELNTVLMDPSRLVGIHFFNPVAKMPLVEIIFSDITAISIVDGAMHFVGRISRLPIKVRSTPGFLVNRLLMPYLLEAVQLVEEGVSPQRIDRVAKTFGMPMGPITLADTVGLDVCLSVGNVLTQHYGGSVPEKLSELVKSGHYGCKSGEGFYQYRKGKKLPSAIEDSADFPMQDIQDRLIFRMLNEAATCLQEGIIENADFLDAGMIFGTGFAPFRGGPMQYAKQYGIDKIQERFNQLKEQYGERFTPSVAWQKPI